MAAVGRAAVPAAPVVVGTDAAVAAHVVVLGLVVVPALAAEIAVAPNVVGREAAPANAVVAPVAGLPAEAGDSPAAFAVALSVPVPVVAAAVARDCRFGAGRGFDLEPLRCRR